MFMICQATPPINQFFFNFHTDHPDLFLAPECPRNKTSNWHGLIYLCLLTPPKSLDLDIQAPDRFVAKYNKSVEVGKNWLQKQVARPTNVTKLQCILVGNCSHAHQPCPLCICICFLLMHMTGLVRVGKGVVDSKLQDTALQMQYVLCKAHTGTCSQSSSFVILSFACALLISKCHFVSCLTVLKVYCLTILVSYCHIVLLP